MEFLSKEKRQLLAQTLNQARPVRHSSVGRRESLAPAPLSFAQQRLWFLHHLDPSKGHCNTPVAIKLTGALEVEVFRRTLLEVVRRQESFRTTFPLQNGEPVQVISTQATMDFQVRDLSDLAAAEREPAAKAILHEESLKPFDIAKEFCVRFRLLRLEENLHWLVLVAHHMVFDTWSMGVFSREMSAIYGALREGRRATLPELEIQYADFACWEKQAEEEGRLARQLAYWKTKLQGAPEMLPLPLDRPRKPFQGSRGKSEPFLFGESVSNAVQALGQQERSSIFMILLAAFAILLHRYGGGSDLVISSAVGNRKLSGTDGLIGCFMNTLLFRVQLAGDQSFRDLLQQIREDGLAAHEHSDVPFEQVVAALNPKRNPNYSPYSQVMLINQNAELPVFNGSGITIERLPTADRFVSQQDLTIHVRVLKGRLQGLVEYNSDIFDQSTIQRLLNHFEQLLTFAVSHLDLPISQLNVLTPLELEQVKSQSCKAGKPPLHTGFLHKEFEQQAERTPDSIAVTCEGKQLTYTELNHRANQLAQHLQKLGAKPEQRVAICLRRSPELVTALLGTLKSGAVGVVLDTDLPRPRLRAIFRETAPIAVITESQLVETLDLHNQLTFCMDSDWSALEAGGTQNLNLALAGDNLSFILYTAGTTGNPKPVMLPHKATAEAVYWLAAALGLHKTNAQEVFATHESGYAALALFAPLTTGGNLAIFSNETSSDGHLLLHSAKQAGVTTMFAAPLSWRKLLDSGEAIPEGLKVLCGGEPLTQELATDLLAQGAQVWNLYGAVESLFWPMMKPITAGEKVRIGSAIANTCAFGLDPYAQLAPIGVPCELFIGGNHLARGYLNRPELTAERFLPNPLADEPGARLYKTGDRVRYLAERQLDFLHRADQQVLFQGVPVRLGEIEAALCHHSAVSQAVVTVRATAQGNKVLVAYVVPRRNLVDASAMAKLSPQDLEEFLKMQLPDYLVPAAFLIVQDLPQTANGKVNRRALPEPEIVAAAPSRPAFRAPTTATEIAIADIWATVLQLERISIDDDFFALGGDSLKAQRALARIERELGFAVPIRVAFANPTVALLAGHIDHTRSLVMTEEDELENIVEGLSDEEVHALLNSALQ
ncbi:MAG: AMP-binding protein [Acidobacteria bacterium]|nr:AMP-binding protein [Acidobacteriota bacterium]